MECIEASLEAIRLEGLAFGTNARQPFDDFIERANECLGWLKEQDDADRARLPTQATQQEAVDLTGNEMEMDDGAEEPTAEADGESSGEEDLEVGDTEEAKDGGETSKSV